MINRILAAAALVLALAAPSLAQNYVPAGGGSGATTCAGITDAGTVCPKNVGTSGATVPLNSTANTFALGQTMASAAINGTGGAGYVEFGPQSAQPSTPAANTFRIFANATGKFTWIGANGFLRVFDGTANTADRTYTLPDVTGTMTVLGNASTGSGSVVLQGTPTLTTPVLGVATGTSLALGGATIGTDALGVTGTATISTTLTANTSLVSPILVQASDNARLTTGGVRIQSNQSLGWSASGGSSVGADTFLTRAATATIQHGAADAAAPVAQTIKFQDVVAGTNNTAGVNATIQASAGTGTGAGGSLIFQVAPAGSTGTAKNAWATALTIDSTKLATFAGAITASNNVTAGAGSLFTPQGRGGFGASADGFFNFSNNAGTNKTGLGVPVSATLLIGNAPNAAPVANTLTVGESSRAGTDTNVAGANGTISSGNGTGNAAVSGVTIQAPTAAASGTGAQTQTNVAVFKTTGVTITPGIIAGGSAPTLTGTCATATQVGGNTAGSFVTSAGCSATTVIITFATTAPNGWVCDASDETTPADSLKQTSHTTTSCTLTGTTVAADVVVFHASAF